MMKLWWNQKRHARTQFLHLCGSWKANIKLTILAKFQPHLHLSIEQGMHVFLHFHCLFFLGINLTVVHTHFWFIYTAAAPCSLCIELHISAVSLKHHNLLHTWRVKSIPVMCCFKNSILTHSFTLSTSQLQARLLFCPKLFWA